MAKLTEEERQSRIGQRGVTEQGLEYEIIDYQTWNEVTIKFLIDGSIKAHVVYGALKNGKVKHPKGCNIVHIGETIINCQGEEMQIIDVRQNSRGTCGCNSVLVRFAQTGHETWAGYKNFRLGGVKDVMLPQVYGIGYLGIGDYNSSDHHDIYQIWYGMLRRAGENEAYKDVIVDIRWHNFQNFAAWYESNYPNLPGRWELDKDLLSQEGKVYGPDTCCFLPSCINSFLANTETSPGFSPIRAYGVDKFAICPTKWSTTLVDGFTTYIDAFNTYQDLKTTKLHEMAEEWKEQLAPRVYQALLNFRFSKIG